MSATVPHDHIQVAAYFRYLCRLRKGIAGDHLADWFYAVEKVTEVEIEEEIVPNHRAGMAPRDFVDEKLRRMLGYIPSQRR
jgi:hypothetical protein